MIATAHGRRVLVIGTGSGSSVADRLSCMLKDLERELSIEGILVELNEMRITRCYPASVLRAVKRHYVNRIRNTFWVVPVKILWNYPLNEVVRGVLKIPSAVDRMVNKRKTFLRSLINEK